jgi:hypothetical protein
MVGKNREFNLEIIADLGRKKVRGIGGVKWTRLDLPYLMKMGVSLEWMREDEKRKWLNFVLSQGKSVPPDRTAPSSACSFKSP